VDAARQSKRVRCEGDQLRTGIASQRKQLETYAKVVLQDAEERTRLEILCEFYRDMFEDSIVEEKTELW
jgi:hypothetical protein